jgi:hypothetical protein
VANVSVLSDDDVVAKIILIAGNIVVINNNVVAYVSVEAIVKVMANFTEMQTRE